MQAIHLVLTVRRNMQAIHLVLTLTRKMQARIPVKSLCARAVNDQVIMQGAALMCWTVTFATTVIFLGNGNFPQQYTPPFKSPTSESMKLVFLLFSVYYCALEVSVSRRVRLLHCDLTGSIRRNVAETASICNHGHIFAECPFKSLCWNCREPGHTVSNCPNEGVCRACGKAGHVDKDCSGPALPPDDIRLCGNCYKHGHLTADCTNDKACKLCRKTGHLARDCQNEPVCNLCNLSGHISKECPEAEEMAGSHLLNLVHGPYAQVERISSDHSGPAHPPGDLRLCNRCYRPGHLAAECTVRALCWKCHELGHVVLYCPNKGVCSTCGKADHTAGDCLGTARLPGDNRLCNNCYKYGHFAADCTNDAPCKKCRKTGHKKHDCQNEPVCYYCNLSGHLVKQCEAKSKAEARYKKHLERCDRSVVRKKIGHVSGFVCKKFGRVGHMNWGSGQVGRMNWGFICNNCGGRGHIAPECTSMRFRASVRGRGRPKRRK